MSVDLKEALTFTIGIAREAGKMILDGQNRRFAEGASEDEKLNSVDLVTEVDKAVEAFLTEKIQKQYPSHKFIGEETYAGEKLGDEPTWIGYRINLTDPSPIDGTTNFVHGFPMVCTSIGLAIGGVPVVGVVYNPFMDQLYSAAKGHGAFLNEKTPLPFAGKPKPLFSLGQALIGVEYGSSRKGPALDGKMGTFRNLAADTEIGGKMVHSLRSVGSAAINICLVATGGLDIYWELGCWPWDVCAGMCILSEAGGASYGGKEDDKDLAGEATAKTVTGRKYLFIRKVTPPEGQSVRDAQAHLAREFYSCATEWTP